MTPTPHDSADCEELIRRAWEQVRQLLSLVDLPAGIFIGYVHELLPEVCKEVSLRALLENYDLEGVYLACACLKEIDGAENALERGYISQLPALLKNLRLTDDVMDEVCQRVRTHLLIGTPPGKPRLATFTGRGRLMSWINVIATRIALRLRVSARETPNDNVGVIVEKIQASGTNPELAILGHLDIPEVKRALRDAIDSLDDQQRYLLRLHYFKRLTTTKMGKLFGKDQSTISRWLKEAREQVYQETKRLLKERLDLTTQEFESLMESVKSRFDMSLSQIFDDSEDGEDKEEEKKKDEKEEEEKKGEGDDEED